MTCIVAGLPIRAFAGIPDVLETIFVEGSIRPGFALAVNAEKIVTFHESESLRELARAATILYADGISVVYVLRRRGYKNVRIPGADLWLSLMRRAAVVDSRVLLIGATEEVNAATAHRLKHEWGLENIKRVNGYFESDGDVISIALSYQPDIVTVALGSPKQELLIKHLRAVYPNAFYMGVGGSYDAFTGRVTRAPKWIQHIGLEWLYRVAKQPWRIARQKNLVKFALLYLRKKI